MEREKAKAVLEAVLFSMGESVELERLAEVIEEDNITFCSHGLCALLSSWRIIFSHLL